MATITEQFEKIKQQIQQGQIEILLNEFDLELTQLDDLFDKRTFKLINIIVIANESNRIKIKGVSESFLFNSFNCDIIVEVEFILVDNKIDICAICKPTNSSIKFSELPSIIGNLLKPLDSINFTDLCFVISSRLLSVLKSEVFDILDDKCTNIISGINLICLVDIEKSGDVLKLISSIIHPVLGDGPYFLSWNIKNKLDLDFNLSLSQSIKIIDIFNIKQPKLVIKPFNPPRISINGNINIPLVSNDLIGEFDYFLDRIEGKFKLDELPESISTPLGFPGVHLLDFTLIVGFSEVLGVEIGAEGHFYLGSNKPITAPSDVEFVGMKSNQYKFIFANNGGTVNPVFLYLYLEKLTFEELIKAQTNKEISLPHFLNEISLNQVIMHWCDNPTGTEKPDGTIAFPIFGLSAIVNLFELKLFTEFKIDSIDGITGKLIAEPINIGGLLKLSGNGSGSPLKYKGERIAPGGFEILFNSLGTPAYFIANVGIEILGLASTDIKAIIDNNGIQLELSEGISGVFREKLFVVYKNIDSFELNADLNAGLKDLKLELPLGLGKIDFSTNIQGSFTANFVSGSLTTALNAHFELIGIDFNMGTFSINIQNIKDIPQTLFNYIVNNCESIFSDLLSDCTVWLNKIKDNLIEIADEMIGKSLVDVYHKTSEQVAKLSKEILQYEPARIVSILKGAGENPENIVKLLTDLAYPEDIIKDAILIVIPGVHIDLSWGHINTGGQGHVAVGGQGHIDIGGQGHINEGGNGHINEGPKWLHLDTAATPHLDTAATPHMDTAATPHLDTAATPHIDTKNHIDI